MREYQTGMREERVLSKVVCNGCGREIPLRGADYFHAEKTWGYFSEQDGRQDAFDLCEECYRKMTEGFRIKIEENSNSRFWRSSEGWTLFCLEKGFICCGRIFQNGRRQPVTRNVKFAEMGQLR